MPFKQDVCCSLASHCSLTLTASGSIASQHLAIFFPWNHLNLSAQTVREGGELLCGFTDFQQKKKDTKNGALDMSVGDVTIPIGEQMAASEFSTRLILAMCSHKKKKKEIDIFTLFWNRLLLGTVLHLCSCI